jgi:hypothetical protein
MADKNVWEEHAKRLRRQEELKRLDEWLEALHRDRPILFNLLTFAICAIICGVAIGLRYLLGGGVPNDLSP